MSIQDIGNPILRRSLVIVSLFAVVPALVVLAVLFGAVRIVTELDEMMLGLCESVSAAWDGKEARHD